MGKLFAKAPPAPEPVKVGDLTDHKPFADLHARLEELAVDKRAIEAELAVLRSPARREAAREAAAKRLIAGATLEEIEADNPDAKSAELRAKLGLIERAVRSLEERERAERVVAERKVRETVAPRYLKAGQRMRAAFRETLAAIEGEAAIRDELARAGAEWGAPLPTFGMHAEQVRFRLQQWLNDNDAACDGHGRGAAEVTGAMVDANNARAAGLNPRPAAPPAKPTAAARAAAALPADAAPPRRTMRVKLSAMRVLAGGETQDAGAIIEVSPEEARRLIERKQAVAAPGFMPAAASAATAQPAPAEHAAPAALPALSRE